MTRNATKQSTQDSSSRDHGSGSRSGRNASFQKSASAAPAWGGVNAAPAPAAPVKGFEHGLGTPGKAPEVPSSMKAGGGKGGSGGRKPRRPVEGDAAAAAAAAPGGKRYVAPGSRTKSPVKGDDQSAKPEEVTELNFGAPLFLALARFLTIGQSMAILAAMFVEGLLNATPEEILRDVEERVDERLQRSHPVRFCGAYLKRKCRHGSKCRDPHLSHEGLVEIGYFVEKEYTGWFEDKVFHEANKPVAGLIVERYGLRKTKSGDIVCDKTAPPQLQRWFGAHTSRGAWKAYQPEEAVTLLLRASMMRAKVFLARDARKGKKSQTFTLGLSIKLNGREFTATCFEDLLDQVHRVDPEWGTWFEGDDCCVPEGYLLHPTSKNTGYVLGTIFGLKNNPNLLKTHPQYEAERQRVSGRNDREAMIGAELRKEVFSVWIEIQALKAAIWKWDHRSGKPLKAKICGTTKEYCIDCATELKERWLHEYRGGQGPFEGRDDIVLRALIDESDHLKEHLRDATWCPGHAKREANRRKRAEDEDQGGKKPKGKSDSAANQFAGLTVDDE